MSNDDEPTSVGLLREAHALWYAGRPAEALGLYRSAVTALGVRADAAHEVEVKSAYALCLCEVGDFAAAFEIYPVVYALCCDHDLDATTVLRQWAKALEQTRDFKAARLTYEKVTPTETTAPEDRLKWHHAMGLLNWRDGQLSEARQNLSTATGLMPDDPAAAALLLAVLGNDALLSIELGGTARALRLVDRMLEIHAVADTITLSNEINLIRVRAALEKRRGDRGAEATILKDGVDLIEARVPEDWMRRLDMVSDYVASCVGDAPQDNAVAYLADLCAAAPDNVSWIGRFLLARLQVAGGEGDAATGNLVQVIAQLAGSGAPAGEVEVVIELAQLSDLVGTPAASIFLGKLALKYLSEIAHVFEGAELRKVLDAGGQIASKTTAMLQASGRFEEAQVLEQLIDRVERFALILRRPAPHVGTGDPVLFDAAERLLETAWLDKRHRIAAAREGGAMDAALSVAERALDELMSFEGTSIAARVSSEVVRHNWTAC